MEIIKEKEENGKKMERKRKKNGRKMEGRTEKSVSGYLGVGDLGIGNLGEREFALKVKHRKAKLREAQTSEGSAPFLALLYEGQKLVRITDFPEFLFFDQHGVFHGLDFGTPVDDENRLCHSDA